MVAVVSVVGRRLGGDGPVPSGEGEQLGVLIARGELVRGAFTARPVDEPVWASLATAYDEMLAAPEADPVRQKLTEAIGQASLACVDVALIAWARPDENRSARTILRITLGAAVLGG